MQESKRRFDPIRVVKLSLLLTAIFVVGSFSFYQASQLTNLAEKIYRHPLAVSNALRDVQICIYTMDRSLRDAILATTPEQVDRDIEKIDAHEQEAFTCFDLVEERFLGDKRYVLTARRDFENWRAIRSEVIVLIKQGRKQEATAIIRGENAVHIALINEGADGRAGINYLLNFARNKAIEFQNMAKRKERTAILQMFFVLVLTILLCIVIVVLERRSIRIASSLQKSEERNRLLRERLMWILEKTGVGTWFNELPLGNLNWDEQTRSLFFVGLDENPTIDLFWSRLHPDDREPTRLAVENALRGGTLYDIEHRAMHPRTGTIRWIRSMGQGTYAEDGMPMRFDGINYDITPRKKAQIALKEAHQELERRVYERTIELTKVNEQLKSEISVRIQAEEDLKKSEEQLKTLSSGLLRIQEQEKKEIVQELHDSVGQALTSLKFSVEDVLNKLTGKIEESVFQSLDNLIPRIQSTIVEINRIGRGLRPSMLDDLGILLTISWFCREFQEVYSGIHIDQEIAIEENDIPENLKVVIFRVLQESLNNVAKHSGADLVRISLKKTNSSIEFFIKDNGKGFNLQSMFSKEVGKTGLGLTGIVRRMEFSGGSCEITSDRESGTLVKGQWPC